MDLADFKDILEYRRNEFSNLLWVYRELSAYPLNSKLIPQQHKNSVLNSLKIRIVVETLSKHKNVPEKAIEAQVKVLLDEIGFDRNLTLIRWLGYFLTKIVNTVCTSIYINEQKILPVKHIISKTPVIYMPNHRSYADFILMSYVLFTVDIAIPAIAAGMDFYSMKGMATVLRNTGAFYMRRSYNEDQLYWDVFRQYVNQIVTKGESGVEFFIEGMRSRSNKSLPPKFGLFFMIIRAFITSQIPDIHLVPINISYDRIMEEKLFAFEHLGIPKPRETTRGFLKSLSILKENYGNIYVNFGNAVSVREHLNDYIDRLKYAAKPLHMQELHREDKIKIAKLGEHIVDAQKQLTILNPFNLVSTILMNHYMNGETIININELIHEVFWLKSLLEQCGYRTSIRDIKDSTEEVLKVHKNFIKIDDLKNISVIQIPVQMNNINPNVLKGHTISEEVMKIAVPCIMLQIYVNPLLQLIVNQCILVTILNTNLNGLEKDNLLKEYLFLRKVFNKEFTLFDNKEKQDFETNVDLLISLKIVKDGNKLVLSNDKEKIYLLYLNLLKPFLIGYYTVCTTLQSMPQTKLQEKIILSSSQKEIEKIILSSVDFINPYTLSLNMIGQCLQSLVDLDCLKRYRENGSVFYDIHHSNLLQLFDQLGKFMPAHSNKLEGVILKTKL